VDEKGRGDKGIAHEFVGSPKRPPLPDAVSLRRALAAVSLRRALAAVSLRRALAAVSIIWASPHNPSARG
jgi:hypothetical protein